MHPWTEVVKAYDGTLRLKELPRRELVRREKWTFRL